MSPIGKLFQTAGQQSRAQKCSKLPIFELPTSPAESSTAAIEQFLQGKVAVEGSRKNSGSHRPDKLPMMPQSPTESSNVAIEQFLCGDKMSKSLEQRLHERLYETKNTSS